MFPPFPQEAARHYCQKLISLIEEGKVELKQCGRQSEERKGQGLMIGALVCWDKIKKQRVILYAVSGNNKKLQAHTQSLFPEKTYFVPSIASSQAIEAALFTNDKKIHQLTDKINNLSINIKTNPANQEVIQERKELLSERTKLTDESLSKVFSLYIFTAFNGKKISLNEIIALHGKKLPPTGTGDCCAPKLLSFAFLNGLEAVSMDEIYFGPDSRHKKNGLSYPPCDERCAFILPSIIGLEILYRDKSIIVVNKPSGLLSVPGKGEEKQDSVESRVHNLIPESPKQCAVHRLDMETSGILILALTQEAHRKLNEDFASGKVRKKYIALLDGILYGQPQGRTELPFRLDTENRPHQIYDKVNGKLGITNWKKIKVEKYNFIRGPRSVTRIEFIPETGRTHQLRLAASCSKELGGLGLPISGDSLYGKCFPGERLMLHASEIEFQHPISNEIIHISCPPSF